MLLSRLRADAFVVETAAFGGLHDRDALTEKYAKDNNVTKSAARVAVMKTPEGRRLYNESVRA